MIDVRRDSLLSLRRKGDLLIVEHPKSRFAIAQSPFALKIEDPEEDATTVLYIGEGHDTQKDLRQNEIREFVIETIPVDAWISRKDLVSLAGNQAIPEKAVDQVLKQLQSNSQIKRQNRKPSVGRGGTSAHFRLLSLKDTNE